MRSTRLFYFKRTAGSSIVSLRIHKDRKIDSVNYFYTIGVCVCVFVRVRVHVCVTWGWGVGVGEWSLGSGVLITLIVRFVPIL